MRILESHLLPFKDAVIALAASLLLLILEIYFDLHEKLHNLMEPREGFRADEIILGLIALGIFGLVFGVRRHLEVRRETRRGDAAEKDVNWVRSHDQLTRLLNRNGLRREAEKIHDQEAADRPYFAMTVDINNFRHVNDIYGQDVGDCVLMAVADRIRSAMSGCRIARIASDQFYIYSPASSFDNWESLGGQVLREIEAPIDLDGKIITVTASCGLAVYPRDAKHAEQLVRVSIMAMRAAKKERSSTPVWFSSYIDIAVKQRAELAGQLKQALIDGEVQPYYQPIVSLPTGKVIAFEALARWRQPDGGFISPAEFIPIAEETGLIGLLFDVLFSRACQDIVLLPEIVRLSFNLSAAQLSDKGLTRKVEEMLRNTGLSPSRLDIEITESLLQRDIDLASAILDGLREIGIGISIDDFGTGYSSLSQLSNLNFDKIKIDQSFIASFLNSERQTNIVRSIIGLGRGLGMKTIAEGVESQTQVDALLSLGCQFGQGFLFSQAVPIEQAMKMADEGWTGGIGDASASRLVQ